MSESLFDSFGVSADTVEVPEFASVKPGTYTGRVLSDEIVVGTKKDPDAINLVIKYELENVPFPVQEFFGMPSRPGPWDSVTVVGKRPNNGGDITEDSQNKWLLGILKGRLVALGIPEAQVNAYKPGMLSGAPVVVTLVKNGDYTNVKRGPEGARALPKQDSAQPTLPKPEAPQAFTPAWG